MQAEHDLILVALNQAQIAEAKRVNGRRKRITHGLLCGPYGQIFGTENHCRKYFDVWGQIFPRLFRRAVEADGHEISDFRSTFNLVNTLIEHDEALKRRNR